MIVATLAASTDLVDIDTSQQIQGLTIATHATVYRLAAEKLIGYIKDNNLLRDIFRLRRSQSR